MKTALVCGAGGLMEPFGENLRKKVWCICDLKYLTSRLPQMICYWHQEHDRKKFWTGVLMRYIS
jgi:hypothetical protein